jgi:hypothetical protein
MVMKETSISAGIFLLNMFAVSSQDMGFPPCVLLPGLGTASGTMAAENEASAALASVGFIALNLFPGFGVESFVHGDPFGGRVQLLGEAIGYGVLIWGGLKSGEWMDYPPEEVPSYVDVPIILGQCLLTGARCIWGVIRPVWFASRSIARLRQSRVTLGVTPFIRPSTERRELRIGTQVLFTFALVKRRSA